ncbi:MAG: MFS transporter [Nitrososphaeria archaeon]
MAGRRPGAAGYAGALAVIVTVTFAFRATNSIVPPTMSLMARGMGFTESEIGALALAFMGSTFASSALVNARLRPGARRRAFVVASVAYSAAFPLFCLSGPLTIWALAALAGFSLGFVAPNLMTSAAVGGDRRSVERALALYTLALSASLVVSPSLEGLILRYFTLRQAFLLFEPMAALVGALSPLVPFPEEPPGRPPPAREVMGSPGFAVSLLNQLAYQIPFAFVTTFSALYAVERFGASSSAAILLYVAFYSTSLAARSALTARPAGNLAPLMLLSAALTLAGLAAAWAAPSIILYAAALAILGVPHGLTYTLSVISLSRAFDLRTRSAANSYFSSTMMLLGAFLPALVGVMAGALGLRTAILALAAPVAAIFAASLALARRLPALLGRRRRLGPALLRVGCIPEHELVAGPQDERADGGGPQALRPERVDDPPQALHDPPVFLAQVGLAPPPVELHRVAPQLRLVGAGQLLVAPEAGEHRGRALQGSLQGAGPEQEVRVRQRRRGALRRAEGARVHAGLGEDPQVALHLHRRLLARELEGARHEAGGGQPGRQEREGPREVDQVPVVLHQVVAELGRGQLPREQADDERVVPQPPPDAVGLAPEVVGRPPPPSHPGSPRPHPAGAAAVRPDIKRQASPLLGAG